MPQNAVQETSRDVLQYVKCSTLGLIDIANFGNYRFCCIQIMAPMFLLLIHNFPKYESLLYGEQADAEASPEYEYNSIAVPTL